ncbi:dTDP-4-dehydrorhamnose reductase [Schaalia canis]|uniref:dTDP-4-dehydrorhamnose reductase n=1 Tax=Schaalia canis TaxID=100469 RepID=A0A3P1SC11_9ACTO|nr:dTDP-4-dehydrorhamnose reductase [Schaalia canis]RRC94688.1 dTDP-4-dehydrorhamnose reductase [Schaalia canis]
MKWTVTGAAGMLGQDLVAALTARGDEVTALDVAELDILDGSAVMEALGTPGRADVVVNCAAWTQVDSAEEKEGLAFRLNAVGPQNLAAACQSSGARFVHISTDYVFPGNGVEPYGENDPLDPLGAYGRTKAAGEWAVRASGADYLIVRTAWLYGEHGTPFPKVMARLLTERGQVDVVTDQVGQPTWTKDLAALIITLIDAQAPSGTYHGTSSGMGSWFDFTQEIAASMGIDSAAVGKTTSEAFVRPAPRPSYSVLTHDALRSIGIEPIGDWRERWQEAAPAILADFIAQD